MQNSVSCAPHDTVRVVITGIGAVSPFGHSATSLWEGVKAGQVSIRPVQRSLPMETYLTRLGGEVPDLHLLQQDYPHPAGHQELTIDFALKATQEAIAQSGLSVREVPPERWGVVMGTCMAGLPSSCAWYDGIQCGEHPDPKLLVLSTPQASAEAISSAFDLKGPVISIATACAASANAIAYAADLIRTNQADIMLAGGTDVFSEILFAGFNSLESLAPDPAAPYSRDRKGLSLGEGSGMLVLMRAELAARYDLSIFAEVLGYTLSADGYHPTAPHPQGLGASYAIRGALANAGLTPDQVDYINGHGTGTNKNDVAETRAIKLALTEDAYKVAISSTKSMIGHLLGAAGAVEAIVTVKALQEQLVPPTANYTNPDPECDLNYVPNAASTRPIQVALSNNFAFGGNNICIAFGRGEPTAQQAHPIPAQLAQDRVVITGLSALTPAGCDLDQIWDAFVTQKMCAKLEQGAWVGRVHDFDPSPYLSAKERRRMDRLGIFSVVASQLVLRDAGLQVEENNRHRLGLLFGTGIGPMDSMEQFYRPLRIEGTAAANPAVFPNMVYNAATGLVAMHTGVVGPTSTVTTGHAAGASALCYAYHLLATNQADAIICLAADTLTDTIVRGYRELNLLRTAGSEQGLILAEGAVALMVERLSHAQSRGAHIYGEMVSYGTAADAQGIGKHDPRGRGIERAMSNALSHAQASKHIAPSVSHALFPTIWANATGYRALDSAERAAIRRVTQHFPPDGQALYRTPHIVTPKTLLGEPIGAGGLLNSALALKAWQQRGDYRAETEWTDTALINSSSLGGAHFSLILTRTLP